MGWVGIDPADLLLGMLFALGLAYGGGVWWLAPHVREAKRVAEWRRERM